jgi:hypothetical protein
MDFDKLFKKCKKDNDYLAILNKLDEAGKIEFNEWIQNSDLAPHHAWMLKPIHFQEISKLLSHEQSQQLLSNAINGVGLIHMNSLVYQGFLSSELRKNWFEQLMLNYANLSFPVINNGFSINRPVIGLVMESILTPEEKIVFLHDLRVKIINGELNPELLTQLMDSVYMDDVVSDIPPEQKKEIYLAVMRQIPFQDLNELPFFQYLTPAQIKEYLSENINDENWQMALKADFGAELNMFYQFKLSLEQKMALYEVAIVPHVEWIIKNNNLSHYIDHLKTDEEKAFVFNVFLPALKENYKSPDKFWKLFSLLSKYQFPESVLSLAIDEFKSVIQLTDILDYHAHVHQYGRKAMSPAIQEQLFEVMLPQLMQSIMGIRDAQKRLESLTEVMNDFLVIKLANQGQSTLGYGRMTDEQSKLLNVSEIEKMFDEYKPVIEQALFDKAPNHQKFEFLRLFTPSIGEIFLKNVLSGHIQDVFKDKFDLICLIQFMKMSSPDYHEQLIRQMHEPITNVLSKKGVDDLLQIYSQLISQVNDKIDRHILDIKKMYPKNQFQSQISSFPKPLPNLFMQDGVLNINEVNLQLRDERYTQLANYSVLKNDYNTHERRVLAHDIEDFVLSDFGKKLPFAQQFLHLFPEDKGIINVWLREGGSNISQLFKDWISKQGLDTLKIIPLFHSYPEMAEQFRFSTELPFDIVVLKESFLSALEKDLDTENAMRTSSVWSIFSGKKSSGFDESFRPEYLKFMGHLMKTNSADEILSTIQQLHEKYPQFVHEKLGENIPDMLKNYFSAPISPLAKK